MNKKLKKSPISIVCYVIAVLSLVYGIYAFAGGISYLNQYFTAYGTSISENMKDAMSYLLSQSFTPLCFAVLVFMCGHINDAVRALDPDNFIEVAVKAPKAKVVETAEEKKINEETSEDAAVAAVNETSEGNGAEFVECAEAEATAHEDEEAPSVEAVETEVAEVQVEKADEE